MAKTNKDTSAFAKARDFFEENPTASVIGSIVGFGILTGVLEAADKIPDAVGRLFDGPPPANISPAMDCFPGAKNETTGKIHFNAGEFPAPTTPAEKALLAQIKTGQLTCTVTP